MAMSQEKLYQFCGFRVVVFAYLLVLVLHVPAGSTEEAATKGSIQEDLHGDDKTQRTVFREYESQTLKSCAAGEDGEACKEDPCLAEVDAGAKFPPSSHESCETDGGDKLPSFLSNEEFKTVKPLKQEEGEKLMPSKHKQAPLGEQDETLTQGQQLEEDSQFSVSSNIIRRSMQGLEDMMGQVEKSGVKVFEKLGGVMDQVGLSRVQVMKRLDTVMDCVSESVSESKVRVIKGFDSIMGQVSASRTKMMEDIDHVIDKVAHSKVIEDIRALPGEIRESFVLSVRNRSYVAAGIMVAITTAILVAGAVYFTWCHHDAWSYHHVSVEVPTEEGNNASVDQGKHVNKNGSVNYITAVNNGATSGITDISNGCALARDDGDDDNGEDGPPCLIVNSRPGPGVSGGGSVNTTDLQKLTLEHSDTTEQSSPDSFTTEVDDVHEVDDIYEADNICGADDVCEADSICGADDVHEAQPKELSENDMLQEHQQQSLSFKYGHWKDTPQKCEHQEYGLDKECSQILSPVDMLCRDESTPRTDITVSCVESEISPSKSAISGVTSDNVWHKELAVHVSHSFENLLEQPITKIVRNISPDRSFIGDKLGEGDIKERCQVSSVGLLKLGAGGCCAEETLLFKGDESI